MRLGEIWNDYLTLEVLHPMDNQEFCSGIHYLQEKVMSRVAKRMLDNA